MEINKRNYDEMNENLRYLGIDVEEINNAVKTTEDILSSNTIDYNLNDIDDFNENVMESIDIIIKTESEKHNGRVMDKLSEIIICSYYNETVSILNEYAQNNGLENVEFNFQTERDCGKYQISAVVDGDSQPIKSGEELDKLFEDLDKKRETAQKSEWKNYGDIGYLDEGGVQVKATDREDFYDVIIVVPNPTDEDTVFAGHSSIDISDYRTDESIVESAISSFGRDYTDEELAVTIAENEGLVELNATAFNENGSLASYAISYDAYEVDKLTLAHSLIEDFGIDVSERLEELEAERAEREQEEHDWEDYGDIQIRSTHNEGVYDVVLVVSDENDESKAYAGYTTLDVKYYKSEEYVVNQAAKIYGEDFTDEELIVEIIHNEGYEKALMELDMNAFNEKGENAKLSTSLDAYSINKSELGDKLMDLGIPIDEERLQELGEHNKSAENKKTKQKQNGISLD